MPIEDNYGYAVTHDQADMYANWFGVNGFISEIIYNLPSENSTWYNLRAYGHIEYKVHFYGYNVENVIMVQTDYAMVDHYVNTN